MSHDTLYQLRDLSEYRYITVPSGSVVNISDYEVAKYSASDIASSPEYIYTLKKRISGANGGTTGSSLENIVTKDIVSARMEIVDAASRDFKIMIFPLISKVSAGMTRDTTYSHTVRGLPVIHNFGGASSKRRELSINVPMPKSGDTFPIETVSVGVAPGHEEYWLHLAQFAVLGEPLDKNNIASTGVQFAFRPIVNSKVYMDVGEPPKSGIESITLEKSYVKPNLLTGPYYDAVAAKGFKYRGRSVPFKLIPRPLADTGAEPLALDLIRKPHLSSRYLRVELDNTYPTGYLLGPVMRASVLAKDTRAMFDSIYYGVFDRDGKRYLYLYPQDPLLNIRESGAPSTRPSNADIGLSLTGKVYLHPGSEFKSHTLLARSTDMAGVLKSMDIGLSLPLRKYKKKTQRVTATDAPKKRSTTSERTNVKEKDRTRQNNK
jgi:hypothetical protein